MKGFKTKLIVIVSPDGGGKTSAIHELKALISERYEIHDRHIRFNNIPRIGHLLYKLKHPFHRKPVFVTSKSSINTPIKKHIYGTDVPLWKILIVLAYDVFDYLLTEYNLYLYRTDIY